MAADWSGDQTKATHRFYFPLPSEPFVPVPFRVQNSIIVVDVLVVVVTIITICSALPQGSGSFPRFRIHVQRSNGSEI